MSQNYFILVCLAIMILAFIVIWFKEKPARDERKKERLLRNSRLDGYLDYLQKNIGAPGEAFRFSSAEREQLIKDGFSPAANRSFAVKVLMHMKAYYTDVVVRNHQREFFSNEVGTHSKKSGKTYLDVYFDSYIDSPEQIIAAIIHECTHEYMNQRNLVLSETQKNEELVDAAAVFLGFATQMIQGYAIRNIGENTYRKVGYLDTEALQYIKRRLPKIAADVKKDREFQREAEEKARKEKEEKRVAAEQNKADGEARAKELKEKLEMLSQVQNRYEEALLLAKNTQKQLDDEEFSFVRECFMESEAGDLNKRIKQITDTVSSYELFTENGYKKMSRDIDNLCTELAAKTSKLGRLV